MDHAGCAKCWPSDAAAAWEAIKGIPIQTYLIDETHFIVSIRACPACSQQFLQVTTEWVGRGGEDPIYRTVIPISTSERAELEANRPPTETALQSVGRERRSLKYGWPEGEAAYTYWGKGVDVGPHD